MSVLKMSDLDLKGKRVLIREDLNVPVKEGQIKSDARLVAALPTLKLALEKGAAVIVCSHWVVPTEGEFSEVKQPGPGRGLPEQGPGPRGALVKDYLDGVQVEPGQLVLLENVRFNAGEKKNADELAKKYAALCDIFVMDAFGTAHRAEGSTHWRGQVRQGRAAGPLLAAELDALGKALAIPPARWPPSSPAPSLHQAGLLNSLAQICDQLIVGGGIANTFLAAAATRLASRCTKPIWWTPPRPSPPRSACRCRWTWWSPRNSPRPPRPLPSRSTTWPTTT